MRENAIKRYPAMTPRHWQDLTLPTDEVVGRYAIRGNIVYVRNLNGVEKQAPWTSSGSEIIDAYEAELLLFALSILKGW